MRIGTHARRPGVRQLDERTGRADVHKPTDALPDTDGKRARPHADLSRPRRFRQDFTTQMVCISGEDQGDGFKSLHRDRLFDERLVLPQVCLLREEPIAVPGEIKDLQVRLEAQEPAGQFVPVHLWHHDVGQQQVKGRVGFRGSERFGTIFIVTTVSISSKAQYLLADAAMRSLVVETADQKPAPEPPSCAIVSSAIRLALRRESLHDWGQFIGPSSSSLTTASLARRSNTQGAIPASPPAPCRQGGGVPAAPTPRSRRLTIRRSFENR